MMKLRIVYLFESQALGIYFRKPSKLRVKVGVGSFDIIDSQ